jgi:hypothetical protein
VSLEQDPLSLLSTSEELLERKKERLRSRNPRLRPKRIRSADYVSPLYLQKLALSSPTSGGRSVGIVRSRTEVTEFVPCSFV